MKAVQQALEDGINNDPECGKDSTLADVLFYVNNSLKWLLGGMVHDEVDCGCMVTINFKQSTVEIDYCDKHYAAAKVEVELVESVLADLREGKHMWACVPNDGYCDCATAMVEQVLSLEVER